MSTYSAAIDQAQHELTIAKTLFILDTPGYDEKLINELDLKLHRLMDKQAGEILATDPFESIEPLPPRTYTEADIRCSECGRLLHRYEHGKCRTHR